MMKDNTLFRMMVGIVGLSVLAIGLAVASNTQSYPPQSATVGTNSTEIVAPKNPMVVTTRASSNHYTTLGAYVRVYSNGTSTTRFAQPLEYSCITTGLSATTNLTTWVNNADVTDGTVVWRPINQNRKEVTVINDSDTAVYLALGATAVVNKGYRINANGGSLTTDFAGSIHAISSATNKNVCIIQRSAP